MKFELIGKYKSLSGFITPALGDFCVITGLNGTGKSQLLELFHQLQNQVEYTQNTTLPHYTVRLLSEGFTPGAIKYIPYNGLNPSNLGSMNKQAYDQIKQQILQGIQRQGNVRNFPRKDLAEKIAKKLGKEFSDLNEKDIFDYSFSHEELGSADIFQTNLGQLFYNYSYNREKNNYKKFRNTKGATYDVLTEEEFNEKNINPWELINRFLEKSKSDYYVEGINEEDFEENMTITPEFINRISGDHVQVNALSSGERVIVSLAFCLFNIELSESNIYPKILLLDEPDAPLHPSMSKEFLDVIYDELVIKKGIKVILTTHSPSTVALAREDSIFCMSKIGERFEQVEKDKALNVLTEGLNTISINYENRRQVFVESPYDVLFYEKLYRKLSSHLTPEISLAFISSGESRTDKHGQKVANCEQVINICKTLRDGGNKFIWGIIDWDTENEPEKYPYIKVLGDKNRYAIENYLFDPILLAAILLRGKLIEKSEVGLTDEQSYIEIGNLDDISLQLISKIIVSKIAEKVNPTVDLEEITVSYVGGSKVNIPKWYLIHHGHELEDKILEVFPGLSKLKRGKQELLKTEILDKIIDDMPGLIPNDILKTLKFVQSK